MVISYQLIIDSRFSNSLRLCGPVWAELVVLLLLPPHLSGSTTATSASIWVPVQAGPPCSPPSGNSVSSLPSSCSFPDLSWSWLLRQALCSLCSAGLFSLPGLLPVPHLGLLCAPSLPPHPHRLLSSLPLLPRGLPSHPQDTPTPTLLSLLSLSLSPLFLRPPLTMMKSAYIQSKGFITALSHICAIFVRHVFCCSAAFSQGQSVAEQ